MSKKVIFIVVGVVFLLGGAVLFLQLMGIWPFESSEVAEKSKNSAKAISNEEGKNEDIELSSIPMEPIGIPIIQKGKVALNLELDIQVQVYKNRESIFQKKLPIVRDAYVRDLFSFIPRQLRKSKQLDLETLNRRLKVIGQRLIGKGIISAVNVKKYAEAGPIDTTTKAKESENSTDETKNKEE